MENGVDVVKLLERIQCIQIQNLVSLAHIHTRLEASDVSICTLVLVKQVN
jgi:hypothetical protein